MAPRVLRLVGTKELRDNFSQAINQAAYGTEPVVVMRRGRKIAAIISIEDLALLLKMKRRRDEVMKEKLPSDQSLIGPTLARRLQWELFFG